MRKPKVGWNETIGGYLRLIEYFENGKQLTFATVNTGKVSIMCQIEQFNIKGAQAKSFSYGGIIGCISETWRKASLKRNKKRAMDWCDDQYKIYSKHKHGGS